MNKKPTLVLTKKQKPTLTLTRKKQTVIPVGGYNPNKIAAAKKTNKNA